MNGRFKKFQKILFTLLGAMLLLVGAFGFWITRDLPTMRVVEINETDLATRVYSSDNQILGSYFQEENRIDVKLNEVPQELLDALIATEDVRFYEHSGLDMKGFVNIFYNGFMNKVFGVGQITGGSTLTQQLARNLYDKQVGRDKSVWRKIKEAIVAVFLESKLTKKEIVEHYLNTVPWGGNNYGVMAASKDYFGKEVKDLKPHESALLIGLLKGASAYDPRRKPEKALARRNTVIGQMAKYNVITEARAEKWMKEPLDVVPSRGFAHNEGIATYFRSHLNKELLKILEKVNKEENRTGEDRYDIYTSGLRVYTTINARMQQHAEEAMKEHLSLHQILFDRHLRNRDTLPWVKDPSILDRAVKQSARYNDMKRANISEKEIMASFHKKRKMRVFRWNYINPNTGKPDTVFVKNKSGVKIGTKANVGAYNDTLMTPMDSIKYYARFLEPGVITIDPSNGHILAWVGGIDHEFFKYDHVGQGMRQVGSTFKPFVYATAFTNNYSPCMKLLNEPVTIRVDGSQAWTPKNADGVYGGEMELRKGLALSVNVVTARLIDMVNPRNVVKLAHDMGIENHLDPYHSIALGTFDLSVKELTAAYATMANKGVYREPIFITRIEDNMGKVIYKQKQQAREAMSEQAAYLMTDMLRSVVTSGTAANLHWKYDLPMDVYACGKTGTTQRNSDAWFAGFTPRLATGVWVGCGDRGVHFTSVDGQGGIMAMPIWALYMKKVYEDPTLNLDRKPFFRPQNMTVETDCSKYYENNNNNNDEGGKFNPDGE